MSSSRSSNGHYRDGHQGSSRYQKKGFLGNLISAFTNSSSHNHHSRNHNQNYSGNPANRIIACSKCNAQIPNGSKFCLQCGEKVNQAQFCVSCGDPLTPNAKFCSKCGTSITI